MNVRFLVSCVLLFVFTAAGCKGGTIGTGIQPPPGIHFREDSPLQRSLDALERANEEAPSFDIDSAECEGEDGGKKCPPK